MIHFADAVGVVGCFNGLGKWITSFEYCRIEMPSLNRWMSCAKGGPGDSIIYINYPHFTIIFKCYLVFLLEFILQMFSRIFLKLFSTAFLELLEPSNNHHQTHLVQCFSLGFPFIHLGFARRFAQLGNRISLRFKVSCNESISLYFPFFFSKKSGKG